MGELTQEQFDKLLQWLDADRHAAGLKYQKIHLLLIKLFVCRGSYEAELLADVTIDRVAAKIDWLIANYVGNPILYFYGVGHKVLHENLRSRSTPKPPFPVNNGGTDEIERDHDCLEACLAELPSKNRVLVSRYYHGEKKEKITNRKKLAEELNITLDALRIRAHRVRRQLQGCVIKCIELNPVG